MTRAQAQAVCQRTQAITFQDSFHLVKCLIRVSVYHVCWMRGLFPDSSFTGHDLEQLAPDLHVKILEPRQDDDEAATLKQWVEEGVMDAVSKRHLKAMYFGIARDREGTQLLEEYIYSFKYGNDGVELELAATAGGGRKRDKFASKDAKQRSKAQPGVDDVRYQVVRLMRMLVALCQTLDEVPQDRFLFMKLTYHDDAPPSYEPPHFHGVAEEGIGHFERRPFSMSVGAMDTHHHTVSVRVKSVLDSCGDDDGGDGCRAGEDPLAELQGSQQVASGGQLVCDYVGDAEQHMDDAQEGAAASGSAAAGTDGTDDDGDGSEDEAAAPAAAAAAAQVTPRTAAARKRRARDEAALAQLAGTETDGDHHHQLVTMMDEDGPDAAHVAHAAAAAAPPPAPSGDETAMSDGGSGQHHQQQRSGASNGGDDDTSASQAYEAVRAFCLQPGRSGSAVDFNDALARFVDVSSSTLARVFEGLCREGVLAQAGPKRDVYLVLQPGGHASPPAPTTSAGIVAEAHGPDSQPRVSAPADRSRQPGAGAAGGDDQLLSNGMSGLSVGPAGMRGGRGATAAAAGAAGGSVMAAAMHAGSLQTGQPGAAAATAPTAAVPQCNTAAAGDEPSVQQGGRQGELWMEQSQHSHQGPGAAASDAAAGLQPRGAVAAKPAGSRLRKASYVNSPIHQHPGKRARRAESGGAASLLFAAADGPSAMLPEPGSEAAAAEQEVEPEPQQQPAAAAAAAAAERQAGKKKVKAKRGGGGGGGGSKTPVRGGRLAAMRG